MSIKCKTCNGGGYINEEVCEKCDGIGELDVKCDSCASWTCQGIPASGGKTWGKCSNPKTVMHEPASDWGACSLYQKGGDMPRYDYDPMFDQPYEEEPRNVGKTSCGDGYCGADDCFRCHPNHFDDRGNYVDEEADE